MQEATSKEERLGTNSANLMMLVRPNTATSSIDNTGVIGTVFY